MHLGRLRGQPTEPQATANLHATASTGPSVASAKPPTGIGTRGSSLSAYSRTSGVSP